MAHNHPDCSNLAAIEQFKTFFDLSTEIPDDFLSEHLISACLKLQNDTGLSEPSTDKETQWKHAQYYLALSYVLPHLNLFTLHGAASTERFVSDIDARFVDTTEINAHRKMLLQKYDELATTLRQVNTYNIVDNLIAI